MKFKSIIISSLFATSILCAQSGSSLFNTHCSSCHADVISVNETGGMVTNVYEAPYVKDIIRTLKKETINQAQFVSFIKDYINMPSKRKSLYGKKALKEFGLMPSLSGVLTDNESTRLAKYLYNDYGKEKITNNKNKNAINTKDSLFTTYCSSCHAVVLGVNAVCGVESNVYGAPYVKDVVQNLKKETKTKAEFVSFIKDYINMPTKRKSLYSKKAVKKFGLMPSLSGVLTDKESTKLANDLYTNY